MEGGGSDVLCSFHASRTRSVAVTVVTNRAHILWPLHDTSDEEELVQCSTHCEVSQAKCMFGECLQGIAASSCHVNVRCRRSACVCVCFYPHSVVACVCAARIRYYGMTPKEEAAHLRHVKRFAKGLFANVLGDADRLAHAGAHTGCT